jgi:hypothetical protein
MQNGGAAVLGVIAAAYVKKTYWPETKLDCVFGLSVITDEITQDFGQALEVVAARKGTVHHGEDWLNSRC